MKALTLLGATGSIGQSTLDIVARHPQRYRIHALTARDSDEKMLELCRRFEPRYAVMADTDSARQLEAGLAGLSTEVLAGAQNLDAVAAAEEADIVVAAIVGAAGLAPTLAAVRAGKRILLANKESLVMAGALFMDEVRRHGAELLPVDSEHNAIFQCLPPGAIGRGVTDLGVQRIILTGSGGPFRDLEAAEIERVTPEQACAHPNWDMGPKISVDSATMMNKGLEMIEACWLSAMDRCSRSSAIRICAPRSPMRWPGRNASTAVSTASTCCRSPSWISALPTNHVTPACGWRARPGIAGEPARQC